MKDYRITFSNLENSYSMVSHVPDEHCYLYEPGEYIGEASLKKVINLAAGLDQSEECPLVFRINPPTRILIEDITPVNYISPQLEECLL